MSSGASPVTLAILNYERRDLLRRALAAARRLEYPDLDILVVDNASTDGSAAMVGEEFPGVRVVALPANLGCAARNEAFRAARGEIVVTLDNDVLLADPRAIERVAALFSDNPGVACIDFKILDASGALSDRDWCHPRPRSDADTQFATHYVLEGASACRRDAFIGVGGYWAPLFLGHEGLDLALRLLDAGHDLLYAPSVQVTHLASPEARPSSRIYYTYTRNAIWISLRNHRPLAALRAIALDVAMMSVSSARAGHLGSFARALRDALAGAREALRARRPLRRETYRRIARIRRREPGLAAKALRHLRERPI